jgi:hypothetical protein
MSKSKVRQDLMRYWFYGGMTGIGGHGIVFYIWHRVMIVRYPKKNHI